MLVLAIMAVALSQSYGSRKKSVLSVLGQHGMPTATRGLIVFSFLVLLLRSLCIHRSYWYFHPAISIVVAVFCAIALLLVLAYVIAATCLFFRPSQRKSYSTHSAARPVP